jgi:hypothetical protein
MYRFVPRRSRPIALVALVGLLSFARTSAAQTPRIEIVAGGATPPDAGVASAPASQPQREASLTKELDSLRVFKSTRHDSANESAVRVFVECHISRHPLLGIRSAELACPLLFAEAKGALPSSAAEARTPVSSSDATAD